ncbi:MAG: nuclear transport factor 2 family protein [Candidatus Doudnabacteria bacterium]|nr:nuclear transport factor 2 family protein [Candidatus Doudnabacteria bacterium]
MTNNNKQAALEFLELVVAGRIDQAYQKHVDMVGKHHNAFFAAGFPALQKAMKENHVQFSHKQMTIKHTITEGDLVAVHSHVVLDPGKTGLAVVHLFRFQDGKIVEMWDCGQAILADSPNNDGMF